MVTALRPLGHVTAEAIPTWLSIDNKLTSPVLTDNEIVDSVTSTMTATTQPEEEDENDITYYEPTPAISEVVKGL